MDALRTLVVGTDLGSFARAAARLGRSQSAISMQLKKLEQQAGQQLLRRSGRGLVATEAGDALLAYARRIIALNDEVAASLGARAAVASVRIGLPQDFADQVLPRVLERFCVRWPHVHVEARAGRNYALSDEVFDNRLDVAITFCPHDADNSGTLICRLPMLWIAAAGSQSPLSGNSVPLVVFDHPCLFRQAATDTLEAAGLHWRLSLTTPSLPGVWAALHTGLGVSVRTRYGLPTGIQSVGAELGLPPLPAVQVRLIAGSDLSPAATDLHGITRQVLQEEATPTRRDSRKSPRRRPT